MQAIETIAAAHNIDAAILTKYTEYEGFADIEEAAREFVASYAGTIDSLSAWAEHYVASGFGIPENLRHCFSLTKWIADQEAGGLIRTMDVDGGIAVFYG